MRCEEVPERGAEGPESRDGPPALTTALSPRRKHPIMRDPQDIAEVCGHESVEAGGKDGVDTMTQISREELPMRQF